MNATTDPRVPDHSDLIRAFDALNALLQQIRKVEGQGPFVSQVKPSAPAAEEIEE